MSELTHLDAAGHARMVDVADKPSSLRTARARALIRVSRETAARVRDGDAPKGDVLGVARIAGIQAAKRTAELIPLCHPLGLDAVDVRFFMDDATNTVRVEAEARLHAKTGVEVEAMTAASVAALTLYDMCKAVQKDIVIERVRLLYKAGGKSGEFRAD